MSEKEVSPERREEEFNAFLVSEYLKYGSVDEVFRVHRHDIPISYPSYQRLLDRWGIIKAAGPNSTFSEAVTFMTHLAEENIPLETLYRKMPPSFKTSIGTLHRIYSYIKEGLTRRVGTALILSPDEDREKVLVGRDFSTPRVELGKAYGSGSFPMGFSRKRDARKDAIKRVLQQEVFTEHVVRRSFPDELIEDFPMPFMYIDIADVRVGVYSIALPESLSSVGNFFSFKLKEYEYASVDRLAEGEGVDMRAGISEIAAGYKTYLAAVEKDLVINPFYKKSVLNEQLFQYSAESVY